MGIGESAEKESEKVELATRFLILPVSQRVKYIGDIAHSTRVTEYCPKRGLEADVFLRLSIEAPTRWGMKIRGTSLIAHHCSVNAQLGANKFQKHLHCLFF